MNKLCEKCNQLHDGTYGSGRFCSRSCANARIKTKEIKEKVSQTLKNRYNKDEIPICKKCGIVPEIKYKKGVYCYPCSYSPKRIFWESGNNKKVCKVCNNEFETSWKKRKVNYCSQECITKFNSNRAKNRHLNGEKFGWTTRSNLKPSYPESIAIKFFESKNISYIREYPLGKYFIDFFIEDKKLAIEIDGQQHEKPERALSDAKKDLFIKENGFSVLRIKWPKENIINTLMNIFM